MTKQKQVGSQNYVVSDEARKIADELLAEEGGLNIGTAKIEYLVVYPHITKFIAGQCIKANKDLKFFSDFDYIIKLSGETWDKLNDETKKVLMLHELLHIKVEYNKKKEEVFKIRDHDVKDFSYIISKHGIDWFTSLRTQISSIYDLDPEEESKITL